MSTHTSTTAEPSPQTGMPAEDVRAEKPAGRWTCSCGSTVDRYRGQSDVSCSRCGQHFNAFGQRLRADWQANTSTWDDEISDLEGYELAHTHDR